LCKNTDLKASQDTFWLFVSAVLSVKSGRAVLSADAQNRAITSGMLIDPGTKIIDLAVDSAPAVSLYAMFADLSKGIGGDGWSWSW
jgi:hypothetical protein